MAQQGYIGRNPGDGRTIVNRQTTHVTTGVQTSFTMAVGYEIGYLDVYLNGIKQTETLDYTASDGSTINFSLSYPPVNGDVLEFVAFETLNITNIKSARRNFNVGQDLTVDGNVTIGSSLTVASDLVVNGTFTTINTEILDVEDKTVGIASTSSPSNTTADGAGIVIYGGSDGDKSITWNTDKSNFVIVGGGVSIGTGVTISTPAANVLAFSVNSAEKARFNNFGAFTVGYEGEAWHESTYVGVLQAGSGAWIGQTPGASARAEWVNNAYYDSVNTRWEYIAADEANRIVLENGELKLQSADAGSADGAITWNEKLKMTVGGDFKIGAPTGIGITISSSGNVDSIGIVTASSFVGNGANLTSLNASNIGSGTVPTARLGSGTASSSTFLRGDSTFQTVNTDLVSDTSPQLGGNLASNGNNINIADSTDGSTNRITFGSGGDLQIYHASNIDKIESNGAGMHIRQINGGDIHIHAGANTGASNNRLVARTSGEAELYYSGTEKLTTTPSGVDVSGTVNVTGISTFASTMNVTGTINARQGKFTDDGSSEPTLGILTDDESPWAFVINNATSANDYTHGYKMYVQNDGDVVNQIRGSSAYKTFTMVTSNSSNSDNVFQIDTDRSVKLMYQGSTKLQTTSAGATLSGSLTLTSNLVMGASDEIKLGGSSQMTIWHTGSDFNMYNNTGQLIISNASGTGVGEGAIVFKSGNNNTRWYIGSGGHFYPSSNNSFDIGTSSYRVRNIYTNDLNLSNKGSQNDVDGTWGDYTIQEGESDLFLINKRSGKKFKFMLQEVS